MSDATALVVLLGAVSGALLTLLALARKFGGFFKRSEAIYEALVGVDAIPNIRPAQAGMISRFDAMEKLLPELVARIASNEQATAANQQQMADLIQQVSRSQDLLAAVISGKAAGPAVVQVLPEARPSSEPF